MVLCWTMPKNGIRIRFSNLFSSLSCRDVIWNIFLSNVFINRSIKSYLFFWEHFWDNLRNGALKVLCLKPWTPGSILGHSYPKFWWTMNTLPQTTRSSELTSKHHFYLYLSRYNTTLSQFIWLVSKLIQYISFVYVYYFLSKTFTLNQLECALLLRFKSCCCWSFEFEFQSLAPISSTIYPETWSNFILMLR